MNQNIDEDSLNSDYVCRICLESTEEPIVSPCKCKGTMGFIHLSCLELWLTEAGRKSCELCQFKFDIQLVVRYSVGESLCRWLWIRDTTRGHNIRGPCGDLAIAFVITPITMGAIFCCVLAANFYSKEKFSNVPPARFTTSMLLLMVGIIALGYYMWMYVAIQYHARLWYNWWQSQVRVRVIYSQKQDSYLEESADKENENTVKENDTSESYNLQRHTDQPAHNDGSNV